MRSFSSSRDGLWSDDMSKAWPDVARTARLSPTLATYSVWLWMSALMAVLPSSQLLTEARSSHCRSRSRKADVRADEGEAEAEATEELL